ncbi:MAG: hypothetical protein JW910_22615, partial [Anaerolineae bacterium]|nr:hypothetical protein [Anaerolineae bacterium]
SAAAGDETLIEQIALPLDMPAGRYRWELDCERVAESGDIEVLPVDQAPGYITLDAVTWAGFATLRGVIFPDGLETWSGGSLPVALHWGSLGAADDDYSVFLHLADQDGRVWAQGDGYPRGGDRPATTWTAGETITDVRRIYLPPDLPPGDYRLILGWYDWREDTRVSLPDGADAVTLPVTVINRWPGGSGLP